LVEYHSRKVLQVDLMDDTGAWGHNLEVIERSRSPLQELESLSVTIELDDFVLLGGVSRSKHVGLHRMVDD